MCQIQHVNIKKRARNFGDDDTINADAEVNIVDDMRFQEIGQEKEFG